MKKKTIKKYQGENASQVKNPNPISVTPSGKAMKDSKGNYINPNSLQGKAAADSLNLSAVQRKQMGQQKNGGTMKMGGTKKKMTAPAKKTAKKKK